MKKPIKTYEIKYPQNNKKCEYYGNCETYNDQVNDSTSHRTTYPTYGGSSTGYWW